MHIRRRPSRLLVAGFCALLAGCGSQAPSAAPAPTTAAVAQATAAPAHTAAPAVQATAAPASQPTQAPSATLSDEALIGAVMTEAFKLWGLPAGSTFEIQRLEGDVARVYSEAGGNTTYYFLKRSQGAWNIIGEVGGPVESLDHLQQDGFPESMYSDLEGGPTATTNGPLEAVYAHLGYGPEQRSGTAYSLELWHGSYARVSAVPEMGDGMWYFLKSDSAEVWSVVAEVSMTAQPNFDAARAAGVPEEMLQDTGADAAAAMDEPLAAVYAHLGRSPEEVTSALSVDNVQGPYARVSSVPEMGDGMWFFLQNSSDGGWFVIAEVSMTAQPNFDAAREKGVPEELLHDIAAS